MPVDSELQHDLEFGCPLPPGSWWWEKTGKSNVEHLMMATYYKGSLMPLNLTSEPQTGHVVH